LLSLDADGHVVYDPGEVFAGLGQGQTASDSFTYAVTDSHGAASTATVHVTVTGSAVPEPGLEIFQAFMQDETSANLYGMLEDEAVGAYGRGATVVSIGGTGILGSLNVSDHSVVYTADGPALDGLWGDNDAHTGFTYTVQAANGDLHLGQVEIEVTGYEDPPVAGADSFAFAAGDVSGDLWDAVLANDHDVDFDQTITIASVSTSGALGRISFDAASHSLVYYADTPALTSLEPGQSVHDVFQYVLKDDLGGQTLGTVDMLVTAPLHTSDWAVV
jgi:VCBS repeat-containing protein